MHTLVVALGTGLLLAKLVTEGLLLFVSHAVQHRFVLARRLGIARPDATSDAVTTASAGAPVSRRATDA